MRTKRYVIKHLRSGEYLKNNFNYSLYISEALVFRHKRDAQKNCSECDIVIPVVLCEA